MNDHLNDPRLVHFYRAVVSHMDVWRMRMDATTNWATATAAGMITFTFGSSVAPHYVLLLTFGFQLVFLLMESRRYQTFDLWRRRFRMLNRAMIVPVLSDTPSSDHNREELRALARDMGRTVPHVTLLHAAGFRVRRNYGYLFAVTFAAWLLKLGMGLAPGVSLAQRAAIGIVPGSVVLIIVILFMVSLLAAAAAAPTDDMLDWEATPHRWRRWLKRDGSRTRRSTGEAQ